MIDFYDEIVTKNKIKIYNHVLKKEDYFVIPNSYYINPNGFLYNSLSESGDSHKETRLIYPYREIKGAFYGEKIKCINGLHDISLEDKLENAIKNYNRIIENNEVNECDIKCYLNMSCLDYKDPLLMKLILGVITSKISLLEKFIKIKKASNNPSQDMDKIIKESNDDISDILVRLCGFHKIESQVDKTITTTSLNLDAFKKYLDKGFRLTIVPDIVINGEYDKFHEEIVVNRFLDKNPDYDGKILKY